MRGSELLGGFPEKEAWVPRGTGVRLTRVLRRIQQEQPEKALAELQKMWREQTQPLGGKWWKTREELYDA